MIQPLLRGRSDLNRIQVGARGSIQFYAMDKKCELWDQYALTVVDDAVQIDRLLPTWENAIEPLLRRYQGRAWFFSKPSGIFQQLRRLGRIGCGPSGRRAVAYAVKQQPAHRSRGRVGPKGPRFAATP